MTQIARMRLGLGGFAPLVVIALWLGTPVHTWAASEQPWVVHLGAMDAALGRNAIGAADRAWRDAYGAALRSRSWAAMADVGDAARRMGEAARLRAPYEARARDAYLSALFRARAQNHVGGVVRIAESFAALGDREAALRCLRIANGLASPVDDATRARVRALAERIADLPASRAER